MSRTETDLEKHLYKEIRDTERKDKQRHRKTYSQKNNITYTNTDKEKERKTQRIRWTKRHIFLRETNTQRETKKDREKQRHEDTKTPIHQETHRESDVDS